MDDYRHLRDAWEKLAPCALICADGGARHAWQAQLQPTLIVGDLDSIPQYVRDHFTRAGIPFASYPQEKDETDAVLAFRRALEWQPEEIRVFGALGGRIDHTLANLSLLLMGEEQGIPVKISTADCELGLVTKEATVTGSVGDLVSLLALFEDAVGVTLGGFAYPLVNGTIRRDFPCGMSNCLAAETATITLTGGSLVVIRYSYPGAAG